MTKPKGKTPSLLSVSTGAPTVHTCGKATPCDRCGEKVLKGQSCFQIPKMKSGFTGHPIFCITCTTDVIEQTKTELAALEEDLRRVPK
jgi:hypothetical protein